MSKEEDDVEEEEVEEEEEEAPAPPTLEDLKPQLNRIIYNHPTILLYIFEVLFDFLIDGGVMTEEERDAIVREGFRRWSEFGTE